MRLFSRRETTNWTRSEAHLKGFLLACSSHADTGLLCLLQSPVDAVDETGGNSAQYRHTESGNKHDESLAEVAVLELVDGGRSAYERCYQGGDPRSQNTIDSRFTRIDVDRHQDASPRGEDQEDRTGQPSSVAAPRTPEKGERIATSRG